jgi:hypothetical protein
VFLKMVRIRATMTDDTQSNVQPVVQVSCGSKLGLELDQAGEEGPSGAARSL